MSEAAAPVPPPVPVAPIEAKAEVEVAEEFEVNGKKVALTKTQQRTAIQKATAADDRFREAAAERARVDEIVKLFETDPEAALKKLGKDPSKVFDDHLSKKAKAALLTPEQAETERLRAELAEVRSAKEKFESDKKAATDKAADEHNSRVMEQQLVAVANKYDLDANPETLEALCDVAAELLDYGTIPTMDQIAQEFLRREREHIETRDRKVLSKLEGKKLLDYLGVDGLRKVRAALAELDTESLKTIPAPLAKSKIAVKAHVRENKGYVREGEFDKKFLKP